ADHRPGRVVLGSAYELHDRAVAAGGGAVGDPVPVAVVVGLGGGEADPVAAAARPGAGFGLASRRSEDGAGLAVAGPVADQLDRRRGEVVVVVVPEGDAAGAQEQGLGVDLQELRAAAGRLAQGDVVEVGKGGGGPGRRPGQIVDLEAVGVHETDGEAGDVEDRRR